MVLTSVVRPESEDSPSHTQRSPGMCLAVDLPMYCPFPPLRQQLCSGGGWMEGIVETRHHFVSGDGIKPV